MLVYVVVNSGVPFQPRVQGVVRNIPDGVRYAKAMAEYTGKRMQVDRLDIVSEPYEMTEDGFLVASIMQKRLDKPEILEPIHQWFLAPTVLEDEGVELPSE
jgi:hypothetical protein